MLKLPWKTFYGVFCPILLFSTRNSEAWGRAVGLVHADCPPLPFLSSKSVIIIGEYISLAWANVLSIAAYLESCNI